MPGNGALTSVISVSNWRKTDIYWKTRIHHYGASIKGHWHEKGIHFDDW